MAGCRGDFALGGARYNPDNPSEAVLAYGLNNSTLSLLILGIIWTVFIVGMFLLFWITTSSDARLLQRLIVQ